MGLKWRLDDTTFRHLEEMEFASVQISGCAPCKRGYHSCSVLGNSIYIYGGITEDKRVLNDMHKFDISTNTWARIEDKVPRSSPSLPLVSSGFPKGRLCTSPCVSHHTATVIRDRYILITGGWNGRKRSADVYCFDSGDKSWRHITVSGDIPVGLSSHTATMISPKDILIIGRKGGVRTQRRFSGAFDFNFETGEYSEAPFHAASRSGHTANLIQIRGSKEHHLFVFGGRRSGGYELMGSWNKVEPHCSALTKEKLEKVFAQCTVCEEPSGRQHCQTVEIGRGYLFLFGGETWSGVRDNVTNSAFLLDTRHMKWYKLSVSLQTPCIVGHTMCVVGERILVFGGLLSSGPSDTLWEVKLGQ